MTIAAIGAFASANAGVIAAVSTGLSLATQYAQADAQADAQKAQNEAIQEESIRQYQNLDESEQDILYDSHADSLQAQKEYLQARSTVELQAAATGTFGQSVDRAIEDLNTGFAQRSADNIYRREANLDEINRSAENIRSGAESSFNRAPIRKPSFFEAISTGVTTGANLGKFGREISTASREAARGGQRAGQ